jgi:hypothetical protein
MNDDEEIKAAIQRAKAAVDGLEDTLRPIAFKVVLESLLSQGKVVSGEPARSTQRAQSEGRAPIPSNLNEFLAAKAPKSHVDRLAAIAYYSWHSGDELGVTVEEILEGYTRSRTPKPKNVHDVVGQCVRRGFLIESESRKDGAKAWIITPTGEAYVANGLQP